MKLRRTGRLLSENELFGAIFALAILAFVMAFVPVKTDSAVVIGKRWHTWVKLQEDYTTTQLVCTGKTCTPETSHKTRTHETAVLDGGALDPVEYPPAFPVPDDDDWYNETGGEFVVRFRLDSGNEKESRVSQGAFEKNYILGLRCSVKLNIYGGVTSDQCMALGR